MPPKSKLDDPAERAKIIEDLDKTNPKATPSPSASAHASAANKETGAARVKRWKQESWLFAVTRSISNWILISLLLLLLAFGRFMVDPLAHLIGYQVVVYDIAVIDGDTFKAKVFPEQVEARFRLRLIDAPELQQPFGSRAAETLLEILSGGAESPRHQEREVIVSLIAKDEQNSIGNTYFVDAVVRDSVYLNTSSVQSLMVEKGAAWALKGFHSSKRPSQLVLAMEKARQDKIGLWATDSTSSSTTTTTSSSSSSSSEPQEPWEFARKKRRSLKATPTNEQRSEDSITSQYLRSKEKLKRRDDK